MTILGHTILLCTNHLCKKLIICIGYIQNKKRNIYIDSPYAPNLPELLSISFLYYLWPIHFNL